jgi:spermidine/putrescine transport system permease protein
MLGQMRREVTPEVNAIATAFLGLSILLVTLFYFVNRKKT